MNRSQNFAVVRWSFAATVAFAAMACSNDHLPPPSAVLNTETASTATPPAMPSSPTAVKPAEFELSQFKSDSPVASCHIDSFTAGSTTSTPGMPFRVPREGSLNVAGWVGTADENAVPAEVGLRLLADGESGKVWAFKTPTGGDRSDVAAFKGKPALSASGFAFVADVSSLPPGSYHAYLAFEHNEKAFSCNGSDVIVIE